MKKKVLSALLAVALFVGLAVPAFAAFPSSSEAGDEENITTLVFSKTSYTVAEDDADGLNLADELIAYVSDNKIAQEPSIEWSISENLSLSVSDDGIVSAFDNKGSATVTAKAANGKFVSVKVTAVKSTAKYATGWKFADTKTTLLSVDSNTPGDQTIKIAPTPAGSEFTPEQVEIIKAAVGANKWLIYDDGKATGVNIAGVNDFVKVDDDKNVVFKMTVNEGATTKVDNVLKMAIKLPRNDDASKFYAESTKTTKVKVEKAVEATKIMKTGSVTVEVGKTADLTKFVAYGPSNANYGKSISAANVSIEPINDSATSSDYAVLDDADAKVLGVAVGKVKAVVTLGSTQTEIVINVVKRGSIAENAPKLSLTTATLEVGGTQYVTVANVPENAEVKWTVDNGNATIVAGTNAAKIFAKKVGTAKVTCTVNGEEVGTIAVTVKAASTTPTKPGASDNPQTGDSIFAGLF